MSVGENSTSKASHDFTHVLHEELKAFGSPGESDRAEVLRRAHDSRLAGLSFSGGGIRSATFCLGVLQALADLRLLKRFHYLSTVSGGGYIGSWLWAWIHRRDRNLEGVAGALQTAWKEQPGGTAPPEIRFLRRFSNYLTPKLGWLGADTWTVIAIYLRNVLLNMTALVVALAGVLLLPRLLGWGLYYLPTQGPGFYPVFIAFVGLLFLAAIVVHRNLQFFRVGQKAMWTANPLEDNDTNVLHASVPVEEDRFQDWFNGREFGDFVLGFEFELPPRDSSAKILLRADWSAEAREPTGQGLAIQIGGEGPDGSPTTGAIIGRQQPKGVRLEAPGESNRMQILCVGQTCTVRLNGRVVNVFQADQALAKKGLIGSQFENGKGQRVVFTDLRLRDLGGPLDRGFGQGSVQLWVIAPLFLAGLLTVKILPLSFPDAAAAAWWPTFLSEHLWLLFGPLAGLITGLVHLMGAPWKQPKEDKAWRQMFTSVFALMVGGLIGGAALAWMQSLLPPTPPTTEVYYWARLVWMPPAFIIALSLTLVFYIGLCGRALSEAMREWWSRLGAWLLIYTLLWAALFGVALYSPPFLHWLAANLKSGLAALGFGWVLTTISSLVAASSPATGRRDKNRWLEMLVTVGPYVFIAGLVACIAWGIDCGLRPANPALAVERQPAVNVGVKVNVSEMAPVSVEVSSPRATKVPLRDELRRHGEMLNAAHLDLPDSKFSRNWLVLGLLAGGAFTVWLLSRRVDINDFSMHAMYRNRLARCYLGASNPGLRHPHLFTGFDRNDDIPLQALDQPVWKKEIAGPYPIINCSLNLVGGDELAWQERMATAFTFTPKYCGYDFPELPPGFCLTAGREDEKLAPYAASRGPLTLATAMAISGAAASPNMGYHTSPAAAFLMTLFNVRLGWWIGNPRSEEGWKYSSPNSAFPWLLAEMFGFTHARGRYIYLSDGGHFENLGIFELVRRRCRFIVACDAEDDHDFEFGGLGNAIEKCRTDLGVDIELDVEPIRHRDEKGHSRWHCAVGRIRYDKADPKAHAGTLLYLKSSLTGDEDTDVLRYAARSPSFPHETTSDQWFGESQFESYRMLGHHAAMSALQAVDAPENLSSLTTEKIFVELAQRWHPPSAAIDPSFKRRGETLNALYETLRTEPKLQFLSQQIYPEWRVLMKGRKGAPPHLAATWLPESYDEAQAGLYFCNRMIQLMEDIYHDLHLEKECDHPDNRGWINLFKHWAWSHMFRVAWTISAANSGARFQNFCQRVLGLEVGLVRTVPAMQKIADLTKDDAADSPLTSVEKDLLRELCKQNGKVAQEASLRLIEVLPAGQDEADAPKFTVGIILLREARENEKAPTIAYCRVRDHLRRMGMARRGLFHLLDEDMWKRRANPEAALIKLDLFPPPGADLDVETKASRRLLEDIYGGVRLELDGVRQTVAAVTVWLDEKASTLRKRWLNQGDQAHREDKIPSLLTKLKEFDGGVRGEWTFADGRRSEVMARFEPNEKGRTKVTIEHRFLASREVRLAMEQRWIRVLSRFAP